MVLELVPPVVRLRRASWRHRVAGSPERRALSLLGAALALVMASGWLLRLHTDLHLGVIPFHGGLGFGAGVGTPLAVLAGLGLVTTLPRWTARARASVVVVGSCVLTAAWACLVAAEAHLDDLSAPLRTRWDYWQALPAAQALGLHRFLDTYVDRLGSYPVHVQGHPPGMLVLLALLDRVGLSGTGWAAGVIIAIGATTPAAVFCALRWWGAEVAARRALPFLVLSPAVLFVATVADGVFAAVGAWAVALVVAAAVQRRRSIAAALAVAAGALGAVGLHLTYGLVPLLGIAGAVVLWRSARWWLVAPLALGAAAGTAPFALAGFRWWDGLAATRHWYAVGAAAERPYLWFLVADLVVVAVMAGPAVVAALARRLDGDVAPFVIAGLAAVALADVSGLAKGEVERIWLPMLPWLTLAVAGLVRREPARTVRCWLGAQVGLTLVLQIVVAWPW